MQRKKPSWNAKSAVMRARPAAQLGSSYEEDIFDVLSKKNYGIVQNVGMTEKDILKVIGKAAFYFQKGIFTRGYKSSREKALALRDAIARDMKKTAAADKSAILRVLLMLEDVTKSENPVLAAYLAPGGVTAGARMDAIKTGAAQAVTATTEHLKTVARETVSDAGRLVTSAVATANEAAPWYLKPRNLALGALGIGFVMYGLPLLRMLPKPRRSYQQNPVSKRAAAARKYEEFHDRKPTKRTSIPEIDTSELVELGKALEIGYQSDKWTGIKQDYLHEFTSKGKGVRLYATPDGSALVLAGGKLNVEDRGITG